VAATGTRLRYKKDNVHVKGILKMTKLTVEKELEMSYLEYVDHLLEKHGPASCDYFHNQNCVTKNDDVERLDEGLFCHHIDEDKEIGLSDPEIAREHLPSYQKAERLVYCDYIEHLLLHIKIALDDVRYNGKEKVGADISGAMMIVRELNSFYSNQKLPLPKRKAGERVIEEYARYIKVLRYLAENIMQTFLFHYYAPHSVTVNTYGVEVPMIKRDVFLNAN